MISQTFKMFFAVRLKYGTGLFTLTGLKLSVILPDGLFRNLLSLLQTILRSAG